MEAENLIGRVKLELESVQKMCADANQESIDRLEEIKKVSAVQKKVLMDQAEARVREEQENIEKEKKKKEEELNLQRQMAERGSDEEESSAFTTPSKEATSVEREELEKRKRSVILEVSASDTCCPITESGGMLSSHEKN